jgi:hypothetical protein
MRKKKKGRETDSFQCGGILIPANTRSRLEGYSGGRKIIAHGTTTGQGYVCMGSSEFGRFFVRESLFGVWVPVVQKKS